MKYLLKLMKRSFSVKVFKYALLYLKTTYKSSDQIDQILTEIQKCLGHSKLKIKNKRFLFNAYLVHLRLGHINLNRIGRLIKSELLNQLEDNSLSPCESFT